MKTESKKIKGTAWMVGGSKEATEALINALVGQMKFTGSANEKLAAKLAAEKTLRSALAPEFDFDADLQIPESFEEACDMLPNGRESMIKMVIAKAITNQMDKLRNAYATKKAENSNVAEIIGSALTPKAA